MVILLTVLNLLLLRSYKYYYRFDQSDSTNSGHPLLFYLEADKSTAYTTGVTTNGTPGQAGAYTMIAVDSQTPNILYYQCSSHANMGNHTFATSPVVNTGVFLTLPTADGSSGQVVTTNGSGVLSFASAVPADGSISTAKIADDAVTTAKIADVNVTEGKIADNAITLAKMASGTDGNIISYDASGNPVAIATGSDGQVLTSAGAGAQPAFETLTTGKILQVVQKIDTTNRTTTSSTYTSGIGGALQIQPSATSSKILIMASVLVYRSSATAYLTLAYQGSSLATNSADAFAITDGDGAFYATSGMHFLHSPNTTDIKSYDVLMKTNNNGSPNVECGNAYAQAVLTLMEIAG